MARKKRKRDEPDVPVSSFSDIAFLLIIFFIVTTTLSQMTGVRADIPSGAKSDAPPDKTNIVNLHDGELSFNDVAVSMDDLRKRLAELDLPNKTRDDDKIVLLEASGKVPYQQYYEVVAAISSAGGALAIVEEEE